MARVQATTGFGSPIDQPMIQAVLREVEAKLASLLANGEAARIDLRRLPLPPDGLHAIRGFLGKGEVEATVHGVGSCSFEETGTAGVWWGTQRNTAGDTVGEFIEIARIPDLLKADDAEMHDAVDALRRRLGPGT
ncbi:MAG: hydrogenase expression/formation protein [Xanthobacteraceae bacterium]|nr:hydrogenase expression/formation protein [Xanthobacteraceae bacterium]